MLYVIVFARVMSKNLQANLKPKRKQMSCHCFLTSLFLWSFILLFTFSGALSLYTSSVLGLRPFALFNEMNYFFKKSIWFWLSMLNFTYFISWNDFYRVLIIDIVERIGSICLIRLYWPYPPGSKMVDPYSLFLSVPCLAWWTPYLFWFYLS
jgi:hypothetical protein